MSSPAVNAAIAAAKAELVRELAAFDEGVKKSDAIFRADVTALVGEGRQRCQTTAIDKRAACAAAVTTITQSVAPTVNAANTLANDAKRVVTGDLDNTIRLIQQDANVDATLAKAQLNATMATIEQLLGQANKDVDQVLITAADKDKALLSAF